jgi:hypothetical protein
MRIPRSLASSAFELAIEPLLGGSPRPLGAPLLPSPQDRSPRGAERLGIEERPDRLVVPLCGGGLVFPSRTAFLAGFKDGRLL